MQVMKMYKSGDKLRATKVRITAVEKGNLINHNVRIAILD